MGVGLFIYETGPLYVVLATLELDQADSKDPPVPALECRD